MKPQTTTSAAWSMENKRSLIKGTLPRERERERERYYRHKWKGQKRKIKDRERGQPPAEHFRRGTYKSPSRHDVARESCKLNSCQWYLKLLPETTPPPASLSLSLSLSLYIYIYIYRMTISVLVIQCSKNFSFS